jgi:hypothetical protein
MRFGRMATAGIANELSESAEFGLTTQSSAHGTNYAPSGMLP